MSVNTPNQTGLFNQALILNGFLRVIWRMRIGCLSRE
jgi:hypothetical protein